MNYGDQAADYVHKVRFQYEALKVEAKDRQDAGEGVFWPEIRYYTPRGEVIRIDFVILDERSETLRMQGLDQFGDRCDIVVQAQNVQLILKLTSPPEPEPERKSVGFTIPDA